MPDLTRREFLKAAGYSLVGSSLAVMGFSPGPALAEVREYKLARATETRNTCPYCSVACGILMYALGDGAKRRTGRRLVQQVTRLAIVFVCEFGAFPETRFRCAGAGEGYGKGES